MNPVVEAVTDRIRQRSLKGRGDYLQKIEQAVVDQPRRSMLSCGNLAHGIAACDSDEKTLLTGDQALNIGIISAYNDMLSAHQPYERFPDQIREAARQAGGVVQFAGGVPAMCDGITQGRPGMELSLFSRDVIAMSSAIALSHDMFDSVMYLGICDKIVPGLVIGALTFGHLPAVFVPAGPMPSGLPNKEKAAVREAYAAGDVGRTELIAAESASYHSPGTCTFFGTANSNQMLMEFMGLQLPGGSFVAPGTPLRDALTAEATRRALAITRQGDSFLPIGKVVDEATIVNGVVGLLSTGGSTNHTLHLVAMAAAAGITLDWQDFADLGKVVPTLAQVYPNGSADVNAFHDAGGLGFAIDQLLDAGLLNDDVTTILGSGLRSFTEAPTLKGDTLEWSPVSKQSADRSVLRGVEEPFAPEGGLNLLEGDIGRCVVKTSAVALKHQKITAPARVFYSQNDFVTAFEANEFDSNVVVVVLFQGPAANGMPELHRLSPFLATLQNRGLEVALLTDGRMSGASGKVLAAIHATPEAKCGGLIGRISDGDIIHIDAVDGIIRVDADLEARSETAVDLAANEVGTGREIFGNFRRNVTAADMGASSLMGTH